MQATAYELCVDPINQVIPVPQSPNSGNSIYNMVASAPVAAIVVPIILILVLIGLVVLLIVLWKKGKICKKSDKKEAPPVDRKKRNEEGK